MLRRHPDVWAAYPGQGPRDLAPMCWPPIPYLSSRPLWTPQSRELSCPGSDPRDSGFLPTLQEWVQAVSFTSILESGVRPAENPRPFNTHPLHWARRDEPRAFSLSVVDGDRQTERQFAHPHRAVLHQQREGGPRPGRAWEGPAGAPEGARGL